MARSAEVNKMLIDLTVILQTTGGYASHLNKDERSHQTTNDMVRCQLFTAGLEDKFWCYELQHTTFLCRRMVKFPSTITPYEEWLSKKPNFKKLHIFGCTMYLHLNNSKSLGIGNEPMLWLGYGPLTAVLLYWNFRNGVVGRCHHA